MNVAEGRFYQHYKNKHIFKVTGIYYEDDLGIWMVGLVGVHDGRKWCRSLHNFTSMKADFVSRFRELDTSEIKALGLGVNNEK